VRQLSDQFRAQAKECFRLAEEARDRWIAELLEDMGHQLHERADQLESGEDHPPK
jgi:Leu/Phe-tRNA-protein transferase